MCKIVFKSLSLALVLTLIIMIMKKITLLAAFFAAFAMNAQTTVWEDSFETYDDFIIDAIGGYSQIDNDGDTAYGSADYDFLRN